LTAIAAQELLARGISLQAGDTIHYIITDADAAYPPDRVRVVAGLDGTWSYDVSAYETLLVKAATAVLGPLGLTVASLDEATSSKTSVEVNPSSTSIRRSPSY
jgi:DNA polymerase elongation subunit (family B)